ncbi:MAG: RICIN domain-containing protein [Gammaproteobacteria bacterium]
MSHLDMKTPTFIRSMCALTTAALIGSQAAQVQAAEGKTLVDKLPPEIKTVVDNAKTVADVLSGFKGSIDAATVIAQMLGILEKSDPAEEFRKLHQELLKLGVKIEAVGELITIQRREDYLADALEAVDTAAQAVKDRMMPLEYDGITAKASATALKAAMQQGWYLRLYSESIDGNFHLKKLLKKGEERMDRTLVYDWRVGVPALMHLISLRLIVMTAINPNFRDESRFVKDLTDYRLWLKAQYDKMIDGVRCNFREVYSSVRAPDHIWGTMGCADIYTGLEATGGFRPAPATRQETINRLTAQLSGEVLRQMPLFEMRSMLDVLYLYANGGPDLTQDFKQIYVAAAPNLCLDVQWGNPTPGTPVWLWGCDGDHAQRWVYKRHSADDERQSGTIRNPVYDKCLDVQWGNPAPGTPVQIWDCNGGLAQKWTWDPETQVLQNALGTVLDIQWGALQAQTPVWTWGRNEGPAQRWSSPYNPSPPIPRPL